MNAPKSKFVRYYPMPNGLTVRLAMLLDKGPDKSQFLIQYGPETATKEKFFALSGTPELKAAIRQFSDDYGHFLKEHFPDDLAGARA